MAKTTLHTVDVHFGDCDPAGIVFFPNFSRWMDAASLKFFMDCGLPPWRELVKIRGIVGAPLLEINTKFIKSVTYGETLDVACDHYHLYKQDFKLMRKLGIKNYRLSIAWPRIATSFCR